MDSIRTKRVFGTRAPYRPVVLFSINGQEIGENDSTVLVDNSTATREINFQIFRDGLEVGWDGNASMGEWSELTVELWKNSELWKTYTSSSFTVNITEYDSNSITGTSYNDLVQRDDGNWYLHDRSVLPVDDPGALTTNGQDYYFARCYSNEGGRDDFYSWIGPIWVGT
jgi:hypothetical protein